jgi:hypothetical protein
MSLFHQDILLVDVETYTTKLTLLSAKDMFLLEQKHVDVQMSCPCRDKKLEYPDVIVPLGHLVGRKWNRATWFSFRRNIS